MPMPMHPLGCLSTQGARVVITIQPIIRVAVGKSSMHAKEVAVEAMAASERAQLTPPATMQAEEVAVEAMAAKESVQCGCRFWHLVARVLSYISCDT